MEWASRNGQGRSSLMQDLQDKVLEAFPELAPSELVRLAQTARVVSYAKNEWLYAEGDRVPTADWLISGSVELLKNSMSGKNTILHVVREGHLIDHCTVIGSGKAVVSVLALTRCSILRLDAKVFNSVLQGNAALAIHMMRALAVRQRMFINKIAVSQGKISVRRRVAGWLLHRLRVSGSPVINDGITREVLAGLLGLSRESLCRQLSTFADEGFVRLDRKSIIIENENALRKILDS